MRMYNVHVYMLEEDVRSMGRYLYIGVLAYAAVMVWLCAFRVENDSNMRVNG